MNVKEAKLKLVEIIGSTNAKHPKVLVAELCAVIQCLFDEIDIVRNRTKSFADTIYHDQKPLLSNPVKEPPGEFKPLKRPNRSAPIVDPLEKHRRGNAGDAI